jgi:hypothetical protein
MFFQERAGERGGEESKLNLMSAVCVVAAATVTTHLGGGSPFASQRSEKGRGWLPFDAIWNSTSRSSCCLIMYGGNDDVAWINARNKTSNCTSFCIVAFYFTATAPA